MKNESYACVYLKDMEVKIRVGLHPWERKPQRVIISLALYADPVAYLKNPQNKFINYDKIYSTIAAWPGRAHTDLIETLARELLDLCFAFKNVTAARVKISKPDIFKTPAEPGVEIYLTRRAWGHLKPKPPPSP